MTTGYPVFAAASIAFCAVSAIRGLVVGIPYNHYRKVINPNNRTNGDNPYYQPLEWLVQTTNYSARLVKEGVPADYCMARKVCRDMGGYFTPEEDMNELKRVLAGNTPDTMKLFSVLQKITGDEKK